MGAVVTTRGREASLSILTSGYVPGGPVTMILMAFGHVFQQDTDTVSDVVGDEITATDYVRQAVTFTGIDFGLDGTATQSSKTTDFGIVGGELDATITGCYLFYNSGDDATSIIVACIEFVEPIATDGTQLLVTPIPLAWSPTPF